MLCLIDESPCYWQHEFDCIVFVFLQPKNIQKLVYFGKLLKDDSFLREVLTQVSITLNSCYIVNTVGYNILLAVIYLAGDLPEIF